MNKDVATVGGGNYLQPEDISLVHNGVLFYELSALYAPSLESHSLPKFRSEKLG